MTKNRQGYKVTVHNRHDKIRVHSLGGFSSSPQTPAFSTKHFQMCSDLESEPFKSM